eukprot:1305771-Pyramimonas_sp.AAC.1
MCQSLQAAPRRTAFLQRLADMPPMDRYELGMRHWRELAELRAMMRRLLQTRAPNYHPAPRRPNRDDDQAVDDLEEGEH